MAKQDIVNSIVAYVNLVRSQGIKVSKVLLYGSHARETAGPDSDIDIALISPQFGKDRVEEGQFLFRYAWRIDARLEPIPISEKDWQENNSSTMIYEIRKNGVEIEV